MNALNISSFIWDIADDVLRMKAQLDEAGITNQERALPMAT